MRVFMIFVVGCLLFSSVADAKNAIALGALTEVKTDTLLPKVFILGEHEAAFEKLSAKYPVMLLEACNNEMNEAYDKWREMLQEMENYSESLGYDLKSIKIWLNVFWHKDGSIDHMAYYFKPLSKHVDTERFTLFLISFLNNYTFPLEFQQNYAHYGSASFPTMPRRIKEEDKKKVNPSKLAKDNAGTGTGSGRH
ncbi:MAG: hypothetical protein AAGD05_09670 [Bacteroidota bacterium]